MLGIRSFCQQLQPLQRGTDHICEQALVYTANEGKPNNHQGSSGESTSMAVSSTQPFSELIRRIGREKSRHIACAEAFSNGMVRPAPLVLGIDVPEWEFVNSIR